MSKNESTFTIVTVDDILDSANNSIDLSTLDLSNLTNSNNQWGTISIADSYHNEWMNACAAELHEQEEMRKILKASKENEALKIALERVKMIYYMTKDGEQQL